MNEEYDWPPRGCGHAQRADNYKWYGSMQPRSETEFCDTPPRYEGRYIGAGALESAPWITYCEYHARVIRPAGQTEFRPIV